MSPLFTDTARDGSVDPGAEPPPSTDRDSTTSISSCGALIRS